MLCGLTSAGAGQVPDLYRPAVTASLDRPRPGVDVVLCTNTHLVEFCQGLVVRSLHLPLNQDKKVVELRLVEGSQGDWRYLLVRENNSVEFRPVSSLSLISHSQYQGVETVQLGDFHHSGRRMVRLSLTNGEDILTDGDQEYDLLDIHGLSQSEEGGEKGNPEVLKVINARLEHVCEAVDAAQAELETKEKMVEDTLASLVLSETCDSEVTVSQHWVRLVNSELVLGLKLTCQGSSSVRDLSINLQVAESVRPLQFTSDLLSLSNTGSVKRLGWELAGGHHAYLVSVLQLSSVTSAPCLSVSVSYTAGDQAKITQTLHIDLPASSFLANSVSVSFDGRDDTVSYLSLYVTGKAETIKARSQLGTFSEFEDHLQNNQFLHNMTIGAFVYTNPGHILHLALVSVRHVSKEEIILYLVAPDLTKLGLLIKLLNGFLPVDRKFARITKSSSQ